MYKCTSDIIIVPQLNTSSAKENKVVWFAGKVTFTRTSSVTLSQIAS